MLTAEDVYFKTKKLVDKSLVIRRKSRGGMCTKTDIQNWYIDYISLNYQAAQIEEVIPSTRIFEGIFE